MSKLTFRRGFPTQANQIAVDIRKQMGLKATDPIDPAAVCLYFEIELFKLSESDCDVSEFMTEDSSVFSAVTVPRGWRTAIVHNDAHHPNRQRSNICHEMAHCFLGHKCTPPLTESGERIRDGSIEGEANYLGGALLVTNEAALHILKKGLLSAAQDIYGISRQMLDYRLNISGAQAIYKRGRNKGRFN